MYIFTRESDLFLNVKHDFINISVYAEFCCTRFRRESVYKRDYVSVELIKVVRLPLRGIKWAVKLTRTNFIIQTRCGTNVIKLVQDATRHCRSLQFILPLYNVVQPSPSSSSSVFFFPPTRRAVPSASELFFQLNSPMNTWYPSKPILNNISISVFFIFNNAHCILLQN